MMLHAGAAMTMIRAILRAGAILDNMVMRARHYSANYSEVILFIILRNSSLLGKNNSYLEINKLVHEQEQAPLLYPC